MMTPNDPFPGAGGGAAGGDITAGAPPELASEIRAAAAQTDRLFASRYVVLGEVGRGAMGVVLRAWDPKLSRLVAIKVVTPGPETAATELARFQREAKACARLHHPAIVNVFDVGEEAGRPFIVMAFVEGETLLPKLQRRRPLDELVRHAHAIAGALHFAHARGIVHRDVKPSNILVAHDGRAFLTDFGLSRDDEAKGSGLTSRGETLGTPMYMAPEQAQGVHQAVGPASDVYSLGAILYFAATGRPPFDAASAVEIMVKVVSEAPVDPRTIDPEVPPELKAIILRCLAKNPAHRPASAEALAEELEAYLVDRGALLVGSSSGTRRDPRASSGSRRARAPVPTVSGGSGRLRSGSGRLRPKRRSQRRVVATGGPTAPGTARSGTARSGSTRPGSGRPAAAAAAATAPASAANEPGAASADGPDAGEPEAARYPLAPFIAAGVIIPVLFIGIAALLFRGGDGEETAVGSIAATDAGAAPSTPAAPDEIRLHRPEDGEVLAPEEVWIEGEVIGGDLEEVYVLDRRFPVTVGRFAGKLEGLGEGEHRLDVVLAPNGQHWARAVISVDATAPGLQIDAPRDGDALSTSKMTVRGRINDQNPDIAWVDEGGDVSPASSDGSFAIEVDPRVLPVDEDGAARLVIRARDKVGLETSVELRLLADADPPVLSIEQPTDLVATGDDEVIIRGRVEDENLGHVLIGAAKVDVGGAGRFRHRWAVGELPEGEHAVDVTAVDAYGLKSLPETVRVLVDRTPPAVTITAPAAGAETDQETITVAGRVADADRIARLEVAGRGVPIGADGSFTTDARLAPGRNGIRVRAIDRAGNEGVAVREVVRDSAAPAITFDPEPPAFVGERTLILRGAVDEDACTVTVDGETVPVDGRAFEAKVRLKRGDNEIVVVAVDALGHEGREVLIITRGRKKPVIPSGTWWRPTREQLALSAETGLPVWIENDAGIRFVLVPPGEFTMGSPTDEPGRGADEREHAVRITRGFYLGATEVTNEQFDRFRPGGRPRGRNTRGKRIDAPKQPAAGVDLPDAIAFCGWLTEAGASEKLVYRLPSEAEWEWAAKAGRCDELLAADPDRFANRRGGGDGHDVSAPAGSFAPNALGAWDVLGNVWEWTADRYARDYPTGPSVDPKGPSAGNDHVLRGGSWQGGSDDSRAAKRFADEPDDGDDDEGFRVLLELPRRWR